MSTTKTVRLLSVQRHGNAFAIIARSPLLSRGVKGAPVLNRSPWSEAPKDRIVGRYASECEAAYALGALEQRLARAKA